MEGNRMRSRSKLKTADRTAVQAPTDGEGRYQSGAGASPEKPGSSTFGTSLTRRQMLGFVGAGALLAAAHPLSTRGAAQPGGKSSTISPGLEAFSLTDVPLLEGSFLEAQRRDKMGH